jgi:hypothetical protein
MVARQKCNLSTIPFQKKHSLLEQLAWSPHKKSNHQHKWDQPQPMHVMSKQPQCVPNHKCI